MSTTETILEVQLRAAKIPVIGWLAVHYWFAIIQPERTTRWEIWQSRNTGGESWGHLHKNLMPFDRGVGNGASWLVTNWTGETARKLTDLLENSPNIYPHNYCYRYVPGPNSNTYARWILEQADLRCPLGRKAIGQSYVHLSRK